MLQLNNINVGQLWNSVKERRTQILFETTSLSWNELFIEWTTKKYDRYDRYNQNPKTKLCVDDNQNINIERETEVKAIAIEFQINSTLEILENVSTENLQAAAHMVLYMTPCSTSLKKWFKFYANQFKNKSLARK